MTTVPVTQLKLLWIHVMEGLSWLFPDEGPSGLSEWCQRTLSITVLHNVQRFYCLIILIQTEWLCSLFQTKNWVLGPNCRAKQEKEEARKEMREKIDSQRDRTKRSRGQVYQSMSTLQRLNGLMAAKCCDLGNQGRFKAVPGTHKLL